MKTAILFHFHRNLDVKQEDFSMISQDNQEIWWLFDSKGQLLEKEQNNKASFIKYCDTDSCIDSKNACLSVDKEDMARTYHIESCH